MTRVNSSHQPDPQPQTHNPPDEKPEPKPSAFDPGAIITQTVLASAQASNQGGGQNGNPALNVV